MDGAAGARIDFESLKMSKGLKYREARKCVANIARENEYRAIMKADSEVAALHQYQMMRHKGETAHLRAPTCLSNKVDRINRRDREVAAREALINSSTRQKPRLRRELLEKEGRARERRREEMSTLVPLRKFYISGDLDYQAQELRSLPQAASTTFALQLGALRRINMPRNKLRLLVGPECPNLSCAQFHSLLEINLSGNELQQLPVEMGRCKSLTTLSLSHNRLAELPASLLTLGNLRTLDLASNNLSSLPYRFGDLKCIRSLNLSGNMLHELPSSFSLLSSLQHLDLSSNGLPHLALAPPLKTSQNSNPLEEWSLKWDKQERREVWINSKTGEISVKDPTKIAATGTGCAEGTYAYNLARNALAERGIFEWSTSPHPATGRVMYTNNVNGMVVDSMPPAMDRLGSLKSLMTLNVSHNKMFDLPSSLGQCSRLLELDAQDNLLDALPDTLSSMTSLVKARLGSNSLSSLPPSLAACTNITDLGLEANCFQSIPDFIMNLASLTRLNLEGNQLRSLPPALGFLSGTLKELQVQGNPLVDPPADELTGGLEPILWQCRQRYYAMQRSNPPSMRVHKFGIMHEKLELRPKFEMKLMDAVSKSKHSGTFHFMMEGLDEFPRQLFHDPETLPALTSIRLDSNNLGGEVIQWELTDQEVKRHRQLADNAVSLRKVVIAGAGTTTTFVNLCQLSLKSCHLSVLDDSIGALVNLRELHLPRNSLEALPRGLLSLKKLRNLDVSRNRLLSIPPELGVLYHLEDLNLSRNRIEVLPRDFIAGMVHLKTLNVSNNFIGEIPASITGLEGLESLDVGGNCLRTLPTGFGNLRLAIFRASFNRLEFLSDATFEPNLGGALHVLWLANNNLQELPRSIVSLKDLREVQVSGNPMRSPPPELLAEGNAALIQYCRVRSARLVELVSAFKHGGLETLEVYMRPKARGVLSLCDTGYLTPADLAEVDSACDRYVNSKFYEHPMPAREVVEVIHALMTLRRREFCDAIISQLVACLQDHENRTVFGEGVFQRELLRPWGPDKSSVGCFAVSLDALFESFPTSSFTPNGRDSLWSEVQKALPPSIFPYDSAALKLAISTVKCATGCLARMERQVSYSQCECIDWETGQEVRHPAGECQKPSLLVIRVPYSEDDLIRRAAEKNRIKGEFRRIYTECYDFTTSKEGLAHMRQEVKQRKAHLGIQMGECDIVIAQNQVVVKAQKEIMKLARQRQALFDAGQPYHLHNLKDADEATECVASVQRKLDAAQAAINAANERKLEFKRRRDKSTFVELADHARSTLCAKYCIARHIEIIEQGRLMAIKYGWRRQWDGLDGIDFVRWAKERNLRAAYRHEFPSNRVRYKAMLDPLEEEERATYASSSEPIPLHEKYSFEGSSKVVEELKDPVYEQWLLEREEGESANSVQSEGDHQHESGEDDNELMSQKSEE